MTLNELVSEYGSPYGFYRSVYKGTDCGPTIGMLFEQMDGWVYCSDLPGQMDDLTIRAISVSSIVEGSDVEIEPIIVTDPEKFWEAVEEVNEQASFYWNRDNTTHLKVDVNVHFEVNPQFCSWTAGDDAPTWTPGMDEGLARAAFEAYWDNKEVVEYNGVEYFIEEWIDDSTY